MTKSDKQTYLNIISDILDKISDRDIVPLAVLYIEDNLNGIEGTTGSGYFEIIPYCSNDIRLMLFKIAEMAATQEPNKEEKIYLNTKNYVRQSNQSDN